MTLEATMTYEATGHRPTASGETQSQRKAVSWMGGSRGRRPTGSAACRPLQRARSGAGGRRVPTTTASEIRRRWCVKKDVLRAVCGWASCEGAHSLSSTIKTTCIRARRVDDALLWFVWGYLGFFLSRCRASRAMSLNSIRALSVRAPRQKLS